MYLLISAYIIHTLFDSFPSLVLHSMSDATALMDRTTRVDVAWIWTLRNGTLFCSRRKLHWQWQWWRWRWRWKWNIERWWHWLACTYKTWIFFYILQGKILYYLIICIVPYIVEVFFSDVQHHVLCYSIHVHIHFHRYVKDWDTQPVHTSLYRAAQSVIRGTLQFVGSVPTSVCLELLQLSLEVLGHLLAGMVSEMAQL